MKYTVEKTENCFTDAQTYAYSLEKPVDEEMVRAFSVFGAWEIKRNYRRPFYFVRRDGMEIKGILQDTRCKVSYPDVDWQAKKQVFERFLEGITKK